MANKMTSRIPQHASYVLDQLSASGTVTHRKMFGGVGVYLDGVFCAIISSSHTFYLRVGPRNIDDFKNVGMQKFPGGKGAGMPYHEVPEDVLDGSSILREWAGRAKVAALAARKK